MSLEPASPGLTFQLTCSGDSIKATDISLLRRAWQRLKELHAGSYCGTAWTSVPFLAASVAGLQEGSSQGWRGGQSSWAGVLAEHAQGPGPMPHRKAEANPMVMQSGLRPLPDHLWPKKQLCHGTAVVGKFVGSRRCF